VTPSRARTKSARNALVAVGFGLPIVTTPSSMRRACRKGWRAALPIRRQRSPCRVGRAHSHDPKFRGRISSSRLTSVDHAVAGRGDSSPVLRASVEAAEEDSKLHRLVGTPRSRQASPSCRRSVLRRPLRRMIGLRRCHCFGSAQPARFIHRFWERASPSRFVFAAKAAGAGASKVTGESSLGRFEPEVNNRG